jgi:hypothetical protein
LAHFTKPFGIFAVVIGLSVLACVNEAKDADTGTVPAELRGTWGGSDGEAVGVTLTFTADSFTCKKGNGSYTMGSLSFTVLANPDSATNGTYPKGYQFHGTHTAGTGSNKSFIGNEADEDPMFLNTDKAKLCWGIKDAQNWIFTKSK